MLYSSEIYSLFRRNPFMFKSFLKNTPLIVLVLTFVIYVFTASNIQWSSKKANGILEADARGYYAYLPATFIYQDLNFGFYEAIEKGKYFNKNYSYDYLRKHNGFTINKYYAGTAIAMFPFFLIAHFLSFLFGMDMDGYSFLYPVLINFGAICYAILGLWFFKKILEQYQISKNIIALVLAFLALGTNAFVYAIIDPGMSHIYSFCFIMLFIFYAKKYFTHFQNKYIYILAFLLGLIVLIRPVNLLIVFAIPFLAGSKTDFLIGLQNLFSEKILFVKALGIFLSIVFIQFFIYYLQTGEFFITSYKEENYFNFLKPHFFEIFFSYKKGLFVYTPLALMGLIGYYFVYKKSAYQFWTLAGFMLLLTYVLCSWQQWWYGGSFSSRVYLEYLAFFFIPLAIMLNNVPSKSFKKGLISFSIILVLFCQFQIYQFRYGMIHWEDMNKEKYWEVFMKIKK